MAKNIDATHEESILRKSPVSGFFKYLAFIIRRERISTPVWIISLAAVSFGVAFAFRFLFPTPEDLRLMADMIMNPAMQALVGPVYGLDSLTPSMLMAQEMLVFMIIAVAIMNIFFVNRHTRTDEELGRLEMLRALPFGRLTNAASTLFFAFVLNIIIAIAITLALMFAGTEGMHLSGALVYSFSIAASGFLFAAIALLMAQLFTTARGVFVWSFTLMGIFYLMRAFGDMNGNIMSYISPMGIGLKVSSFYENHWWPILVLLVQAVVVGIVALLICSKRDLGEGIIPASAGRRNASRFLQTKLGFAWRLVRGNIVAWSIGMFALGATYGAIIGQIEDFVENNEMFQQLLGVGAGEEVTASIALSFAGLILVVMSMIAVVPILSTAAKLRSEEKRGRTEVIFARSIGRRSMFGSYIFIAAISSIWLMLCAGLGLYSAAAIAAPGILNLGEVVRSSLMFVPAMWTMMGLSVFLIGLLPRFAGFVWVLFGYSFMTVYFGPLMNLPDWMAKLSPFGQIPQLQAENVSYLPVFVLIIIAIVLTFIGLQSFRRRDIGTY